MDEIAFGGARRGVLPGWARLALPPQLTEIVPGTTLRVTHYRVARVDSVLEQGQYRRGEGVGVFDLRVVAEIG